MPADTPRSSNQQAIERIRKIVNGWPPESPPAGTYQRWVVLLVKEVESLQARIDALMLEFCPDEMSPEQLEEWAKTQIQPDETPQPASKTEVESDLAQRLLACWKRIDPTSTDDDPVGITMASALLSEAASAVEYLQAEHDSLLRGRKPTHRCKVCGALWIDWGDTWSLFSPRCGQCCDNAAMGYQIEALPVLQLVSNPERRLAEAMSKIVESADK